MKIETSRSISELYEYVKVYIPENVLVLTITFEIGVN